MSNSVRDSHKTGNSYKIPTHDLVSFLKDWFLDARVKGHTEQSIKSRKARIEKFFWFLKFRDYQEVGASELKEYIFYLQTAHESPKGRWNNPELRTAMTPVMVGNYHRILKAFFNFLLEEDLIESNPMTKVKVKAEQTEIKQPIAEDDLKKLFAATRETANSKRDAAILWMLLDTGLRCSELTSLRRSDFDDESLSIRVLGKGKKFRTVYLSPKTAKIVKAYLKEVRGYDHEPLFKSQRGLELTVTGVYQMIERLSKIARVNHPGVHAFRRTFAVNMRRNQADIFTIQEILGHSDLTMTRRYTRLADNDARETHRRCSPAMHLRL